MRFLTLLLAFMLLGCRAEPIVIPTATPAFPTIELAPQGSIRIEIPTNGTPEAAPRMILSVKLFDEATHQPINDGNIYWLSGSQRPVTDADLKGRNVWRADLYLSGEEDGWLIVQAPGYLEYSARVKYSIETSQWLDAPVRLKRIGEGGV